MWETCQRFYLDMVFHRPKFIQVVINLHRLLSAATKEVILIISVILILFCTNQTSSMLHLAAEKVKNKCYNSTFIPTKIQKLFSFPSYSQETKQMISFLIMNLYVAKQLIHTETFVARTMANIHEIDLTNVELLN